MREPKNDIDQLKAELANAQSGEYQLGNIAKGVHQFNLYGEKREWRKSGIRKWEGKREEGREKRKRVETKVKKKEKKIEKPR